jgi:hypothetical protein
MACEGFSIQEFSRAKDRGFGCSKALRLVPRHQTHPVIFESGCATFPTARFMRGYRGKDEGIDIVPATGFDEYFSEPVRHFRVEQIGIHGAKRAHVFLRGIARDLQSQSNSQYSPRSHAALPFAEVLDLGKFFSFSASKLEGRSRR